MTPAITVVRPLNIRLVNSLRHAVGPVHERELVALYDDHTHFYSDIRVLRRKGMVETTARGFVWAGT